MDPTAILLGIVGQGVGRLLSPAAPLSTASPEVSRQPNRARALAALKAFRDQAAMTAESWAKSGQEAGWITGQTRYV